MKIQILVTYILLLEYYKIVNSKLVQGINKMEQNCTVIYSDCDYREFHEAGSLFEMCIKEFPNPNLEVRMINCYLPAFPNGTFTALGYLNSFKLEMAEASQLNLLSPMLEGYFVFKNLNFRSAVFDICDSPNLAGWKWEVLSDIEHENINSFELNIVRSNLIYLPSSFRKIANGGLTNIRILKCGLKWLGEKVFASFKNLVNLELRDNFIEHIDRSQLPVEASKLRSLDLGNNRLQDISTDFFQNLYLKTLLLDGNQVKILDNQMKIFLEDSSLPFIYGVLWPCNCDEILKLYKFNSNLEHEQCYVYENIMDIRVFMKKCSPSTKEWEKMSFLI